jgi:ribosome-associated translation inhibitor RaiA
MAGNGDHRDGARLRGHHGEADRPPLHAAPRKQEAVRELCWLEAEKLEHYCDHITSCHVTFMKPHRHHRQGNHYDARIRLVVPGKELVISNRPTDHASTEDPRKLVREVFDEARRQLQDHLDVKRGFVKRHEG